MRELESLNEKVKTALSEATAETGKEAMAAADMRREIKRLTEEVVVLAPLVEQLAVAEQQLAEVSAEHTTAAALAEGLATEAAEVGGLKEQLAAAVGERDAALGSLTDAQEIQEELRGADDTRKVRFAKMKASYDTQIEERDAAIQAAEEKLLALDAGAGDVESLTAELAAAQGEARVAIEGCNTAEETARAAVAQVEALSGKLTAAEATAAGLQEYMDNSGEVTVKLEAAVSAAGKERDEAVASAGQARLMVADSQQQAETAVAEAAEYEGQVAELHGRLDLALRAEEGSAAQLIKLRERELGRVSPSKGPATPARTPVHEAYPDGGGLGGTPGDAADIEGGGGYGNLAASPAASEAPAAAAAAGGPYCERAMEVIGNVGAKVRSSPVGSIPGSPHLLLLMGMATSTYSHAT